MTLLNSLGHFERRRVARCLEARLITDRLDGDEAIAAFGVLAAEADNDEPQLAWLLLPASKLIH